MAEDKSFVRKTESEYDDWRDSWKRRKVLASFVIILVLIIFVLPAFYAAYQGYFTIPNIEKKHQNEIKDLKQVISDLKKDKENLENSLKSTENERDKAELKLAPFLAVADKTFPQTPADQRLELLVEDLNDAINKLTETTKDIKRVRTVSFKTKKQIISNLKKMKPLKVGIIVPVGDTDALAYGNEIKKVFEESEWVTLGIMNLVTPEPFQDHLAVLTNSKIDSNSIISLLPLFEEHGYPPTVIHDDSMSTDVIHFLVGPK
ncbi:hypothetical protein JXA32_09100 [Candidatus Sumerlaeota bacterium]|nr:hypothetical protein [Candidatus Sumerlaeota bacterium]